MSFINYALLFSVVAIVGVAITAGVDQKNYVVIDADVVKVVRTCSMYPVRTSASGTVSKPLDQHLGDCEKASNYNEFANQSSSSGRTLDGDAVVTVSYISPADNTQHIGDFHLDGRDRAFFETHIYDRIKILANKNDANLIRKADKIS